ncbi:hypothetical protein [Clostridium sp. C8-1-8]|uniref:hypothetical protein n=1 Tax=Clostridium sp. C8-1-8 TaxID=2698831 RepID=UPI00136C8193|nr:hypothetical protein [Clostridium sp. C8-1-8]
MLTIAQTIFLIILVVIQGTLIFRDAIKNNVPNPWLWGIIGLLNVPSSAIVYLIYKRIFFKRKSNR